ncbi:tetratricopeptide repeat protein [Candidatus Kirkpatrickella diaphorinae]|uniref:Tetratricopeptide repeat protein n=1 Tax=Candidatus Kirkpatrickella diaphorinae TaxID=2984322 RepID=A0ABY6GIB4_9PROT|nr:tetratricopeptide repeat protein [Candidatus Kirkpatrickella diaphorinae]UYH50518.1 tetratricopeptide repeat protein [Candidatus Kirkpatrickella diaphorinae]
MRHHNAYRLTRLFCITGLGLAIFLSASPLNARSEDEGGTRDLVAQLLQRVAALEASQRELRGDVDQLSNQVKTQSEALNKKLDDAQFNAGAGSGTATKNNDMAAAPQEKTESAKAASPADLIKQGKAALSARNFDVSQAKAQAAIKAARDTKTKVDARFLLAQSLAGQKNFKGSALAYFDAYKAAPRAVSAQESLLGVSASMLALDRHKDACEALGKLKHDFPDMSARIRKAYNSFFRRAHCG